MTMIIKQATHKDLLAIASLDSIVWQSLESEGSRISDGEHAWKKWIEFALVFYATGGETACDAKVTGATVAFPTISNGWCLHKLFVDPAYQGCGVGKELLKTVLSEIDRKESKVFLSVDPNNQAAIRLYHRSGFRIHSLEPGYYREHENRYLMVRPVQWADSARVALRLNESLQACA